MDKLKTIILPLLVAVVASVGISVMDSPDIQQIVKETKLGALTGPDIPYSYLSVSGVRREYVRSESLTAATTTPCIFVAPAATSTLISAGMRLDTATSVAYTLTIATSSAATYATTTPLAAQGAPANNGQTLTWLATTTFNGGSGFMKPSSLVVFSMTGGVGTFTPTGACQATFEVL